MKLLFYSHFFSPSIGGVESIARSLASGLARLHGFEVTLVTRTTKGQFDDTVLPFRVVRRPSFLGLFELIRQCDVLHVAGPALAPLMLARLTSKPVVVEHHGYQAICPNGLLLHLPEESVCPGYFQARRYLKCFRCRCCDKSILGSAKDSLLQFLRYTLSRHAAANLCITSHVMRRQGLPNGQVIYYGIPSGLPVVPDLANTSASLCFAYVGRFVPEKGIPVLLEAASKLQSRGLKFELLLIGDGPERRKLEQIIEEKQLVSVRLTGLLAGKELMEVLNGVAVVVMPSIWEETAGLSAIEQMMRGRLVIASAIGGLAEVVGDQGLVFRAGDATALADNMARVIYDPSLVVSLGTGARRDALHRFNEERMVGEHASIYSRLHFEKRRTTGKRDSEDGLIERDRRRPV